ncbi:hypothetical protein GQ53DRAFT_374837 [Thozetella sp. PMI_491]|nr:hypothetical protein GQ53DRAFT_374837 [Thozetella sp. PMI_491]
MDGVAGQGGGIGERVGDCSQTVSRVLPPNTLEPTSRDTWEPVEMIIVTSKLLPSHPLLPGSANIHHVLTARALLSPPSPFPFRPSVVKSGSQSPEPRAVENASLLVPGWVLLGELESQLPEAPVSAPLRYPVEIIPRRRPDLTESRSLDQRPRKRRGERVASPRLHHASSPQLANQGSQRPYLLIADQTEVQTEARTVACRRHYCSSSRPARLRFDHRLGGSGCGCASTYGSAAHPEIAHSQQRAAAAIGFK